MVRISEVKDNPLSITSTSTSKLMLPRCKLLMAPWTRWEGNTVRQMDQWQAGNDPRCLELVMNVGARRSNATRQEILEMSNVRAVSVLGQLVSSAGYQ